MDDLCFTPMHDVGRMKMEMDLYIFPMAYNTKFHQNLSAFPLV